MNWFTYIGIMFLLIGIIIVTMMWNGATPFWKCEAVYNGSRWAIQQCFNMGLGMSVFILGIFSFLGSLFIYLGYKDSKETQNIESVSHD